MSAFSKKTVHMESSNPILVGTLNSSSIFHERLANGEVRGFTVDVVKTVFDKHKIPYKILCTSLLGDSVIENSIGKIDVWLDDINNVTEDSLYYYSDTLYVGHPSLFVLSTSKYKRLFDFVADTTLISTNYSCDLNDSKLSNIKFIHKNTSLDRRLKLLVGHSISGIIIDREEMYAYIAEHDLSVKLHEIPLHVSPRVHRLRISKRDANLYTILTQGIADMKRDGEWASLQKEWFPYTNSQYRLYCNLSVILVLLFVLCILGACCLTYLFIQKWRKKQDLAKNDLFAKIKENLPLEVRLTHVHVPQQHTNYNITVVQDENGDNKHVKKWSIWLPDLLDGTMIYLAYDVTQYINELSQQEKAERTKSVFLANMSHDIRSPLNAVVGFSDVLIHTPVENKEDIDSYKELIVSSSQFMLKLFQDIIDISHLQTDTMTFESVDTDLYALMRQIDAHYCKVLEDRNISFKLFQPYNQLRAILDKDRLLQVIHNIVGNAAKYTSSGTIAIGLINEGEHLLFFCWDTGSGISKERKQQVFNRFAKLDEIAKGTGLGMAICKSIATFLHGEIDLVSQENKGTLFWYRIPVHVDSAANSKFTEWNVVNKVFEQIKTKQFHVYEN